MTLSNKVTALRLLFGPLFFFIYPIDHVGAKIIGLLLVICSEVSDGIDGYLARRRNETTDFGKLFDPFADSISRFTFFLTFMKVGLAAPWMMLIIFYRDSLVSYIRLMASTQKIIVSARKTGKIKAVTQATACITIICFDILSKLITGIPIQEISGVMMSIVVVITFYSAVDYLIGNLKVLSKLQI